MAQYDSLKDYIRLNHLDTIVEGVIDYIRTSSNVKLRINDLKILTQGKIVFMPSDIMVQSEITFSHFDILTFVLGISCEESDEDNNSVGVYYYNVMLRGNMSNRFSDLCILAVEECTQESLISETVTGMFGLPDIAVDNLEEEADRVHKSLNTSVKRNEERRYRFEPVLIKEKFKKSDNMHMWPAELPEECLGQIRFEASSATIYDITDPYTPHPNYPIPANSILLNVKYYRNEIGCDDIITAAHELVHWEIHRDYMRLLQFLDDRYKVMECKTVPIPLDNNMSLKEKARWYAEWQANELAIRVAIPKHLVEEAINEYENSISEIHHVVNSNIPHDGNYYENMIYKLHWDFNVPKEIMKKRLRQLGNDYADGTFVIVDGCTYPAFTFANGTLKENETFVIDCGSYERLLRENEEFAELIENRYYIYTGYVICINDAKYITPVSTDRELRFDLSDYAREHANECCLKLTMHTKQNATTYTPFDYLCKLEDGAYSHIHILTKEALNDLELYKRRKKDKKEAEKILVQMDNANIVSFKDALRFHMSRLKIEPEDMPDELYLKETTFLSYYKANRNPSLKRAMIICNKLNLPYKLCIDLLKRARITLNTDKKEDELYDYLLTITNATLDDWDLFLETNGFNPLIDKPCES